MRLWGFNYISCYFFVYIFSIETTMLPLEDDPLTADHLIQYNVEHFCKLMKFAHEHSPPIFPHKNHEEVRHTHNLTRINGLACSANISLNFLAMDSVHNHHFAEALGIDIKSKKDMTAVVILDSKVNIFSSSQTSTATKTTIIYYKPLQNPNNLQKPIARGVLAQFGFGRFHSRVH